MSLWKYAAPLALLAILVPLLGGCEVVGYNTPLVGGTSWATIEAVDPVTGHQKVSVRTRAQSNTFFGKVMSIFGRPSFTVSCVEAGASDYLEAIIDWREAVGPPQSNRSVTHSVDGADPREHRRRTSTSGRQSVREISSRGLPAQLDSARVLAVRTVNSGGSPVTLVFNVAGFATVYAAVEEACS